MSVHNAGATPYPFISNIPEVVRQKAAQIRLLVLDVDGVLTNGKLYFGPTGEALKQFSILDGLGIKLLQQHGVKTAIITGRRSEILLSRARELGIEYVVQGREDKLDALTELREQTGVSLTEIAYAGDDLPDLAALQACGLGFSVPNGYHIVKQAADWVCDKSGGDGAVREIADILLASKNLYEQTIQGFAKENR